MAGRDTFKTRRTLSAGGREFSYYSLPAFAKDRGISLEGLPISIRVLLENLLRNEDGVAIQAEDVESLARWDGGGGSGV